MTFFPCFVVPFLQFSGGVELVPQWLAIVLVLGGVALQINAKLTLGRSFGLLPARRGLVERGIYSFVRHPIYLAYFMTHMGIILSTFSAWNLAVVGALYTFQLFRILEEEKVLGKDPAYAAYRSRVRYRIIPFLF